ncbi:head maturation protease, ClpP-related [Caproicibacter fermentans]|uniref:head maturation protease, ClpP-related n=1 Tax=Caproicibacter fermentans TaxID=2576756 RepID=UPI001E32C01B|nr:head maturation protease, ClpP-related [Caproicibacter fermentans]
MKTTKPIRTIWAAKQEANTLDIYLYDDVEGDSENWWTGEKQPSDTSANHIREILEAAGNVDAINIYINSYGGEVKEGLGIYNLLKRSKAYKTVYVDGFACSIASVIAMCGDKVIMGTNTLMMIHHASMGAYGTSDELRKAANDVDVIDKASCSSYLEKAGNKLTEETLNQLLDNQTWLTAEQCVQYGLADEIASKEDPATEAANQHLEQAKQTMMAFLRGKAIPEVPKQFAAQKTNAEKLMTAFRKNGGKE